jgi:hypothetical protein
MVDFAIETHPMRLLRRGLRIEWRVMTQPEILDVDPRELEWKSLVN